MSEDKNTEPSNPNEAQPTSVAVAPGRPWLPVAIACGVAALVLLLLIIPGVLLYPEHTAASVGNDDALVKMQQETNKALEKRLGELKGLLDKGVCVDDGQYMLPGAGGQFSPIHPEQQGLLPTAPDKVEIPSQSVPEQSKKSDSLLDLIDQTTVLILNVGHNGMGTGFYIAPNLVVTNGHVVGTPPSKKILVASKQYDKPRAAQVIAHAYKPKSMQEDLALLKVDGPGAATFLSLSEHIKRLDHVITAGFPGLIMKTDEEFQKLIKGDIGSAPDAAVTQGVVTAKQQPQGVDLIVHTAEIRKGNSGGPLIDQCGRVVGVNTFYTSDRGSKANYSISVTALKSFLAKQNLQAKFTQQPCQLQVSQQQAAPTADTERQ